MKTLYVLFTVSLLASGFLAGWHYAPRTPVAHPGNFCWVPTDKLYLWADGDYCAKVGNVTCAYRPDGTRTFCWASEPEIHGGLALRH